MNMTAALSSSTPVLAAQVAAAQYFFERADLVPRAGGLAEQRDADAAADASHCEVCNTALSGARQMCESCDNVLCPACTVQRRGHTLCQGCDECIDVDEHDVTWHDANDDE